MSAARGLQFFGGDPMLYRRALRQFIDMYAVGLPEVRGRLDKTTRERLVRQVHSVAGACAVVGATTLMDQAAVFENALLDTPDGLHRRGAASLHAAIIAMTDRLRQALEDDGFTRV